MRPDKIDPEMVYYAYVVMFAILAAGMVFFLSWILA
jgi:hypothetical protein